MNQDVEEATGHSKTLRPESALHSCVIMKNDQDMDDPVNMSSTSTQTNAGWVQKADSIIPSIQSLKLKLAQRHTHTNELSAVSSNRINSVTPVVIFNYRANTVMMIYDRKRQMADMSGYNLSVFNTDFPGIFCRLLHTIHCPLLISGVVKGLLEPFIIIHELLRSCWAYDRQLSVSWFFGEKSACSFGCSQMGHLIRACPDKRRISLNR